MNRRSFLATILASAIAPAVVRADSLMRIVSRDALVIEIGNSITPAWMATQLRRYSIEQELESVITATTLWRDADWLYCRDGKWRPVEPGTSPLVAARTVRNRVGMLRGAGNAINVAQATGFVGAVMDAIDAARKGKP